MDQAVVLAASLDQIEQLARSLSLFRRALGQVTPASAPLMLNRAAGLMEVVVGDLNDLGANLAGLSGLNFEPAPTEWPRVSVGGGVRLGTAAGCLCHDHD